MVGDEYGGGIVAIADSVSGELVIVPDAEWFNSLKNYLMDWITAVSYAEAWEDGTNTDYRLITKAEALAILTNNALLSQLGLAGTENFWTIEEVDIENAYVFAGTPNNVYSEDKDVSHLVCPVRKANFYGLPLIESEFGGGLVYDVVAATRTVHIVAKWDDIDHEGFSIVESWENVNTILPAEIPEGGETFTHIPTRAQALKIFGNSYLVTLAELPVDNGYWTSEEFSETDAYKIEPNLQINNDVKTELYYALPVRSEVVPET